MTMKWLQTQNKDRKSESGNVLFLILIAVVLFAALSYAVTSSTNSSGGNAEEESNLVSSAALTQYPATIKTAILRMMVSKSVSFDDLYFDRPPFAALAATANGVFHPSGGGASHVNAPADVMDASGGNTGGVWFYNYDFEVDNIGSTSNDADGNEILAFLPGITQGICEKINEELGITGDVITDATLAVSVLQDEDNYTVDTSNAADNGIGTNTAAAGLDGQPYGCFQNNAAGPYVYYHVLLER